MDCVAAGKHIAQRIRCRTVFSTHYHFLTEEMARECAGAVAAYHMHYALDPATGEVTFLYQLRPGVCQKSYGIAQEPGAFAAGSANASCQCSR